MTSDQRTAEWLAERAGKFTGSAFVDVLATSKRGDKKLKAYDDLIWRIVVERMTGEPIEGPTGYALQWGIDVEPFAREAYELRSGNFVQQSGFVHHPEFAFAGCSPDGLIDDDGGLELKCPKSSSVHLERFVSGLPEEYRPQVQGCLWVTGRKWWDFASYDPRMPPSHRLLVIRVERDEAYIATLQAAVLAAEQEVTALHAQLLKKAA